MVKFRYRIKTVIDMKLKFLFSLLICTLIVKNVDAQSKVYNQFLEAVEDNNIGGYQGQLGIKLLQQMYKIQGTNVVELYEMGGDKWYGFVGDTSKFNVAKLPKIKKEGIKKLGETASQIVDISGVSSAASVYVKNMNNASDAISAFASTQVGLKNSSDSLFQSYKTVAESMTSAATDAKGYMQEMQGVTKSLSSINAGYELQLKNIGTQAEMMEVVTSDLSKIKSTMSSAAEESEAFKAQATKLTQQVSSLNNVYGNMLNAFNARA